MNLIFSLLPSSRGRCEVFWNDKESYISGVKFRTINIDSLEVISRTVYNVLFRLPMSLRHLRIGKYHKTFRKLIRRPSIIYQSHLLAQTDSKIGAYY